MGRMKDLIMDMEPEAAEQLEVELKREPTPEEIYERCLKLAQDYGDALADRAKDFRKYGNE